MLCSLLVSLLFLAPTGSWRTIWQYDFGSTSVLREWAPNDGVVGARVGAGHLEFRATGSDPILDFRGSPGFVVTVDQVLEIEVASDAEGDWEVFWSGTAIGPYGGLSQEKSARFHVRGDGRMHTYRLLPFWHRERQIVRLRLDPCGGANIRLGRVRVLQAAGRAARPRSAGDFAAAPSGWLALRGAEVLANRDGVLVRLTDSDATLLAPPAAIDTDTTPYAAVSVRSSGIDSASILFCAGDTAGRCEIPIPGALSDMRLATIDLGANPGWRGAATALGLRLTGRPGATLHIRRLILGAAPEGSPSLRIASAGGDAAVNRTNRAFTIEARVANSGGGRASSVALSLSAGSGVRILSAERVPLGDLEYGMEGRARWRVVVPRAGDAKFRAIASDGRGRAVERRWSERVAPALGRRAAVAPPRPVSGSIGVGVYYFPGWKGSAQWAPISRFPERKPALGWYAEGDPSIADWQVRWAVEHGITFFAYDWYWSQGGRSLEHALHRGLFGAKYGRMIRFCLLWANHNGAGTSSISDSREVARYWIANYFRRSEYQTVDGRPVVIIFTPYRLRADLGADGARKAIAAMREECLLAGLPPVYLIACVAGLDECRAAGMEGYDAVTAYNWPGLGAPADALRAPFRSLLAGYRDKWSELAAGSPIPLLTPICGGWDSRPWHGDSALAREGRTPALFRQHVLDGKAFVEANPKSTLPMLLVEAWNEFGEGSYIEPHREYGFGYLDAIRDVVAPRAGPHVDILPEDIGERTPRCPEVQPDQTSWKLSLPGTGWDSGMAVTDPKAEADGLAFTTIGADNAIFGPPVQWIASRLRSVRVRMRLTAPAGSRATQLQLFWSTRSSPINEAASERAPVIADGAWHTYKIPVAHNRRWRGVVTGLRLDPCDLAGARVQISEVAAER